MIEKRGNPLLHFVDRYVGIPTIAVLGPIRRKRELPSKIDRIGLLRAAAIGDTVLISGVVADLRRAFPKASLVFFAGPSNFAIANMLDGINRVVSVPIGNPAAGIRAVRSIPVDVMIDFGQWPRLEALLTLFSKASYTVGFRTAGQHRHFGYDLSVEHSSDVHEIQNFRRLVEALGVKADSAPFLRRPPNRGQSTQDYAVFHLWPGGMRRQLKQWPREKWLRLAEEFASWGLRVVLTGASSDYNRNEEIVHGLHPGTRSFVRNAAGMSLPETAAILASSRLVVSVDTGIMHMAAAIGVPLVALHGPSASKRWGPVGENAVVVESSLTGCGYISLGWEYLSQPPACMDSIGYESVRDACRALLKEKSLLEGPKEFPQQVEREMSRRGITTTE
jgi:ADP-heptose:LPS heptosyltransferase